MNHQDRKVVSTRRALLQQLVLIGAATPLLSRTAAAESTRNAPRIGAWAPDLVEQQRVAARLTAKILKGAKPGDLPVTHPTGYALTIHSGAAKKLGLTLPPALLAQATRVIE